MRQQARQEAGLQQLDILRLPCLLGPRHRMEPYLWRGKLAGQNLSLHHVQRHTLALMFSVLALMFSVALISVALSHPRTLAPSHPLNEAANRAERTDRMPCSVGFATWRTPPSPRLASVVPMSLPTGRRCCTRAEAAQQTCRAA